VLSERLIEPIKSDATGDRAIAAVFWGSGFTTRECNLTTAILDDVMSDIQRCEVLGVEISAVNMPIAVRQIHFWIDTRQQNYVCITGVHGVMESQLDPKLKQIHNRAGMVTPDGMPMVWVNKLAGNSHVSRVYGPDLMAEVCRIGVERNYKHFLYGGGEGVAEKLAEKLREKFPGIQIVGTHTPPFRAISEEEDLAIVEKINQSGADIVWVGLSTPKQEHWMSKHLNRIDSPVMIGVGAAFDFHAGLKSQAPRFMQKLGMEWFFRLVTEPRRLWKRYCRNNPLFCWYFLLQLLGVRNFSLPHASDEMEESIGREASQAA
jgi:N-acetylglucosaminyldiphosphoundecaprenol N-acetyl-beta-D-mannosaminyltransferase